MAGVAICNYKECINKDNCVRFKTEEEEKAAYDFKHICKEDTSYQYHMPIQKGLEVAKGKECEKEQ